MFLPHKFSVELLTASEIRQTTPAFQKQLRLNEVIRWAVVQRKQHRNAQVMDKSGQNKAEGSKSTRQTELA